MYIIVLLFYYLLRLSVIIIIILMFLKHLYIHVQINVPRLLIEKDVVDINNEILTSITINRFMLLKPVV